MHDRKSSKNCPFAVLVQHWNDTKIVLVTFHFPDFWFWFWFCCVHMSHGYIFLSLKISPICTDLQLYLVTSIAVNFPAVGLINAILSILI